MPNFLIPFNNKESYDFILEKISVDQIMFIIRSKISIYYLITISALTTNNFQNQYSLVH